MQKDRLEGDVSFLRRLIEKWAESLGIALSKLELKLKELMDMDAEIAG